MKNKNNAGFTLLELCIVAILVVVLACALPPLIGSGMGHSKLKSDKLRMYHGLAECWFDEAGVLRSQIINFHGDRGEISVSGGEYCTFKPPKANAYEIWVIGAGGEAVQDADIHYSVSPKVKFSGDIDVESFQIDISAADDKLYGIADKLREIFDEWKPTTTYTNIHSAVGNGGEAEASMIGIGSASASCASESSGCNPMTNKCPKECRKWIHGAGGPSGKGLRLSGSLTLPLNGHTEVTHQNDTNSDVYIYHDGNGVRLTPADEGLRAKKYTNSELKYYEVSKLPAVYGRIPQNSTCIASGSGVNCNGSHTGPNQGASYSDSELAAADVTTDIMRKSLNNETFGGFNVVDGKYSWTYTALFGKFTYGSAATQGQQYNRLFEKVKSEFLYLRPASDAFDANTPDETIKKCGIKDVGSTRVSSVAADRDFKDVLLTACSGKNGKLITNQEMEIDLSDMPFPRELIKNAIAVNDETYIKKLGNVNRGIAAKCFVQKPLKEGVIVSPNEETRYCPGFASSGSYSIINQKIEGNNELKIVKSSSGDFRVKPYHVDMEKNIEDSLCKDNTKPIGSGFNAYCKSRDKAGKGAIIVAW